MVWDNRALLNQLGTFNARMDRAITATMGYHATRAVAYARINAPWKDRSTNARNGLFATAVRAAPRYAIVIGHRVPYGIWLETKWSGRYAIIRPTIDHEGPEVMMTIATLYGKILK